MFCVSAIPSPTTYDCAHCSSATFPTDCNYPCPNRELTFLLCVTSGLNGSLPRNDADQDIHEKKNHLYGNSNLKIGTPHSPSHSPSDLQVNRKHSTVWIMSSPQRFRSNTVSNTHNVNSLKIYHGMRVSFGSTNLHHVHQCSESLACFRDQDSYR